MKKIKKIIIDLGMCVALFSLLWPVIIIIKEDLTEFDTIFALICSIFYDVFICNIIKYKINMSGVKQHYYNYVKNSEEKLNLNITCEEKYKNLELYIENLLNNYFDD